jgi:hypothetical protein
MVFVYFAFWGLQEEFSIQPGTPFSKLLDPRLMQQ